MVDPSDVYEALHAEASTVLVGNDDHLERLLIALFTRGHVLMEGVPGVAKTTIANLFARAIGLEYRRVQMTPDVVPADITGTHVYREGPGEFELHRGPVFTNVLLADEINRATPKTQSALLEAMQERRATIEGETLALPEPFMVIATQNPLELEGVWPLPEAQRDRFQFKLTVDLPEREAEREILARFDTDPALSPESIDQVVDPGDITDARTAVTGVYVDTAVYEYILDIVAATRDHPDIEHGGSPRASIAFLNAAKARAALHDREYVIPDDVKVLADAILAHRLVLSTDAELSGVSPREAVMDVLSSVNPPGSEEPVEGETVARDGGGQDGDIE